MDPAQIPQTMEWWQILLLLSSAVGIGTILGAVITQLGQSRLDKRKAEREFDAWIREKKYNLYLELLEAIYDLRFTGLGSSTRVKAQMELLTDEAQIEFLLGDLATADSNKISFREKAHIMVLLSSLMRKDLRGVNDRLLNRLGSWCGRFRLLFRLNVLKLSRKANAAKQSIEPPRVSITPTTETQETEAASEVDQVGREPKHVEQPAKKTTRQVNLKRKAAHQARTKENRKASQKVRHQGNTV